MARDGVQERRQDGGVEVARVFLDDSEPQMDVSEQPALVGLPERRRRAELADPADVVEKGTGEDDVVPQAGMELRRLTAEGGDTDGVLEEAARVSVVTVRAGSRERPERLAYVCVADEGVDDDGEPFVRDLRGEELEDAIELVRVPAERRRELGGVGVGRLDGPHLHLELPAESLDATEDAHGVALAEALVEEVDVVPDARVYATA